MKIENQLTNLELSRKLEKLGVKQESLWWWIDGHLKVIDGRNTTVEPYILLDSEMEELKSREPIVMGYYSAFTVAELGEMLPERYSTVKQFGKYRCFKIQNGDENGRFTAQISDDAKTEANARAKMLIYLIENGLLKEEIKKEL